MAAGIAKKLAVTYIIIVVATIISGIACLYVFYKDQRTDEEMRYMTMPAIDQLKDMKSLFLEAKKLTNSWLYLPDVKDRERLKQIISTDYPELKKNLQQNSARWTDKKEKVLEKNIVATNDEIVAAIKRILNNLHSPEDFSIPVLKADAVKDFEKVISPASIKNDENYNTLIRSKNLKLNLEQIQKRYLNNLLLAIIIVMFLLVITVSLVSINYTWRHVSQPLKKLKDNILHVAGGQVHEVEKASRSDEIGAMQNAISEMMEGLINKIDFSNNIGVGNYDAAFEPLSETDMLGHALINMRNNLKRSETELKQKSEKLQLSEEQLKVQKEELIHANTVLEENAQLLKANIRDLQQAREALDVKANELEIANKYKSDFLAKMSHELRTPLNSILILSRLLMDNKEKNLSAKQVEYATVVFKSGSDLLKLINEILDHAKVQSGRIELEIEEHNLRSVAEEMRMTFNAFANEKNVNFELRFDNRLPKNIVTDNYKLQQILKNLLSNAFKFTPANGSVILSFKRSVPQEFLTNETLMDNDEILEVSVADTGIGISKDKQKQVFIPFQQAESGTYKTFGGTGLGLSISKELTELLGGEIIMESEEGQGAVFTLYLPFKTPEQHYSTENDVEVFTDESIATFEEGFGGRGKVFEPVIDDDRSTIHDAERSLLIIEDDLPFAKLLLEFAREKGFKAVVANSGDLALQYVEAFNPRAIILDIQLPVINGWTILQKLKSSKYSHIPVHVISIVDKRRTGIAMGASGYLVKPVSPERLSRLFERLALRIDPVVQRILLIENNPVSANMMSALLQHKASVIDAVGSGKDTMAYLFVHNPDIVVLNLDLPDIDGFALLHTIKKAGKNIPVIAYASHIDEVLLEQLQQYKDVVCLQPAETCTSKIVETVSGMIRSKMAVQQSDVKNADDKNIASTITFNMSNNGSSVSAGKKILIVDDDNRNVFALQTVLEQEGFITVVAENGSAAVETIQKDASVDAVLMDIMMPGMDGYETTARIRAAGKMSLPVIGLTARAFPGEREKCLDAGLSDYISKPVDVSKLLNILKVWLAA